METTKKPTELDYGVNAGKKKLNKEKKREEILVEKVQAEFYLSLMGLVSEMVNKLNQKTGEQPDESRKTHVNDFKDYSLAFQNFAQQNISKIDGFNISVPVNEHYKRRLAEFLNSKQQFINK